MATVNMDPVCHWLVQAANRESSGHPLMAEVILQILESTLMPTIIHDPCVQMELLRMVQTSDPGPALESINVVMEMESTTSDIAAEYMRTLQLKHANCVDPPFCFLSSQPWYY